VRAFVCPFDPTVPRFNPSAEPARTVGQFHVLIRRQNRSDWQNRPGQSDSENGIRPVKPDGQWLRKVAKYGLCILIHWQNRPAFSMAEPSVRLFVTTGHREKWRWTQRKVTEKDKTTVGWRAFQVLRARSWNLASRAWNPGPESVRALLIGWSN
jgi:hypothetical protein